MKKQHLKRGLKLSKHVISSLEDNKIFGGADSPYETGNVSCWFMTRVKKCQLTLGPSNCTQC